jgi:hypothetical protein
VNIIAADELRYLTGCARLLSRVPPLYPKIEGLTASTRNFKADIEEIECRTTYFWVDA